MRCKSVACIWSSSPPVHKVTAVAVLNQPSTLYTGGSDGSIIWWKISSNDVSSEVKPIAMLCGHTAPIADLAICFPTEEEKTDDINNTQSNSTSSKSGALISACTEGILSVWSRKSGHCRRRRKMPPWVGNPFMIQTLPENQRYVSIACSFTDHGEGNSVTPKCTVVIVDSYTLTIVQTVFHGNLVIGQLKSTALVLAEENLSVVIVDIYGKIQFIPIMKDSDTQSNDSPLTIMETLEKGLLVSFVNSGQVLALIYQTCCVFKKVDGTIIGEISFLEGESHIIGGIFLRKYDDLTRFVTEKLDSSFEEDFAVWNEHGVVFLYKISYSNNDFKFESLSSIPSSSVNSNPFIRLIQLNNCLIRVESIKESSLWTPRISVWLLKKEKKLKCLGESQYSEDWIANSESNQKLEFVSSSMVVSDNYSTPSSIVYGFYSGKIEIIQLDTFFERENLGPREYKQHLLGHTDAVLCLAAHKTMNKSKISGFSNVLVSGSKDCTVRLWDLDSNTLITTMHHHVASVRQIILPPFQTNHPWSNCFLSVSNDSCVSLVSFDTLRVERIFSGHPYYPEKVLWDSTRGYIACLCPSEGFDVLYIWDVKTGARERVLRGPAAQSMFDHFFNGINKSVSINRNTSASSLLLPINEAKELGKGGFPSNLFSGKSASEKSDDVANIDNNDKPVKSSCPFPGISALCFDLTSLMSLCKKHEGETSENYDSVLEVEGYLLKFTLSLMHLWNVDSGLDKLLVNELKLNNPHELKVACGLLGDRGALTLIFPSLNAHFEIWKTSSEYCALRSLTMVSLAQHMISLSHSCSEANSVLAAFYTRKFAEKFADIKPPSLELLVSFWQNEVEHIKMAARSLFHCAASRAIPLPLCNHKSKDQDANNSSSKDQDANNSSSKDQDANNSSSKDQDANNLSTKDQNANNAEKEESEITSWLESFEMQDWISCVNGIGQDAMTSHIIIASALIVWYPSIVYSNLAKLVINPLLKLVMTMNEKYSCTAAEILSEGMDNTWRKCIINEIPRLLGDIFFQIECVSTAYKQNQNTNLNIRNTLVEILLPSLAIADTHGFLNVIESQIWSTASDSPVHVVALMTLIRVIRGSPRNLAQYLHKVVTFILQTMDHGNSVMRKTCLQSSMTALREIMRVFPMVAQNDSSTKLAVGDAIKEINNASIQIYDMLSMSVVKVLDASGPPGLPTLLGGGASETAISTAISALSFSPDGEGLVAFSENALMIRWWSLESVWWEKLSRNLAPVQCTKLIFVPPWEGFSPNSTRSSIMGESSKAGELNSQGLSEMERLKGLIQNLNLSYRLEWVDQRKVKLIQHEHELGIFQL